MSSSPPSWAFHKDRQAAARPIWREAFVGLEWMALRSSPVYYGFGVPRGDGSAVVVIPGFMGTDFYLQEMYYWLRRIGYRPYMSRIGWNADCLEVLVERLSETIDRAATETGGKVHLIGHSLGGILARSATVRQPDRVRSVVTLGSPFRGIRSHPVVLQTADRVRARILDSRRQEGQPDCYTGHCQCEAVNALRGTFPASVKNTAVYTRTDGIVDWRVCINDDPKTNFEVQGTHVGLVFNHEVYSLVGTRLAQE